MLHQKKIILKKIILATASSIGCLTFPTFAANYFDYNTNISPLSEENIATELGWNQDKDSKCGGYYLDQAFPVGALRKDKSIEITGDQLLFAQKGTSTGQGKITISRQGQQITANQAWLFRNPATKKLSAIKLSDHIILREPNQSVAAETGYLNLTSHEETLHNLYYRTNVPTGQQKSAPPLTNAELSRPRKISGLTAFGQAETFNRSIPNVYEFENVSYSTCPPLVHAWHVRASHIELNKNTGRGTATNARIYLRNVPIFYTPWLNFPIDSRRQTGFLPPILGSSSKSGARLGAPFYWNMAPDHDLTLTPTIMLKRGLQLAANFRYLTKSSVGALSLNILPNDNAFSNYQSATTKKYQASSDSTIQAELRRLNNASTTRQSISLINQTKFNDHWSGTINYNRVSDDYYLNDFSSNLNQTTENQLLQQARLNYENINWQFGANIQGYQTLHPVDDASVENQYIRLPQLTLNGGKPDVFNGFNLLVKSEITHFVISHNPGSSTQSPEGTRAHLQPGIERPINNSWSYFTPRIQLALTQYQLTHQQSHSANINRALPIFDVHSGLYFDRDINIGNTDWQQTLEPQLYYTYVPYHKQSQIPLFDTAANTLNYDQLFNYTRFSGIDRISDANQISYGIVTRFINSDSGLERFHAGIGQIFYFHSRQVTLSGQPTAEDSYNKSPVAGQLGWQINSAWNLHADSIWSVQKNGFDNQNITLSYLPAVNKIINLSYGFVRNGDVLSTDQPNSATSNLSQTDLSFAWPVTSRWSAVGRWTQNWNHHHFQNLLYGLQYDTCCWAVRFVAARAFTGLTEHNTFQYDTGIFVQFALKGLGNFGDDPSQLLNSSVANYQPAFGQTL